MNDLNQELYHANRIKLEFEKDILIYDLFLIPQKHIVIPYHIKLLYDNHLVGSDDGEGKFSCGLLNTDISYVNYQTGRLYLYFKHNLEHGFCIDYSLKNLEE